MSTPSAALAEVSAGSAAERPAGTAGGSGADDVSAVVLRNESNIVRPQMTTKGDHRPVVAEY